MDYLYTVLAATGGTSVVLAALFSFVGRIWIDRIANDEAREREEKLADLRAMFNKEHAQLKAQLDVKTQKEMFIDKHQFEHEYNIYKQVWEALIELQESVLKIRPEREYVHSGESQEARVKRKIAAFTEVYDMYIDVMEKNKPFYSPEVYLALTEVRDRCDDEAADAGEIERLGLNEYWTQAERNREGVIASIERACEAIRTRIARVRIA
jgi:hypothetical protein